MLFEKEDKKLLMNLILSLAIPLLLLILIESFPRGIVKTIDYMITHKPTAFLNYLLLLLIISPAIFFKRNIFAALLLGLPWCILGALSAMVLRFRGVPLLWSDFYNAADGLSVAKQYFTKETLIRVGVWGIIAFLTLRLCYSIYFKKYPICYGKRFAAFLGIIILGYLGCSNLMKSVEIEKDFRDINFFYNNNGFLYSLGASCLNTSIIPSEEVPDDFNHEIESKLYHISNNHETIGSEQPNIIMVQVEALFDPMTIKNTSFKEDPIPNIRKYFSKGYSGLLQVPTLGGSTARTEFEVLTGMNLDFFPPGEIPYNSGITSKGPIETIAYILKTQNYYATAIHNFQGNFYSRNTEFKNLGFDRFIPMESMIGLVKHGEFPEDGILLDYIKKTLDTTSERDFIFTITAGSHGPYSNKRNIDHEKYLGGNLPKKALYQLQNYTAIINKTDQFIGELAQYIYTLEEPTVLVVYSDHYPMLEVVEGLDYEEKYNTLYFIIDNKNKLPKTTNNHIEAYEFTTNILKLCNLKGGVMNVFHAYYKSRREYQEKLEVLQNGMLFEEKDSINYECPYTPTTMEIGFEKLEIHNIMYIEDSIILDGTGFTEHSSIFVDNKPIETKFISENILTGEITSNKPNTIEVKYLGRHDVPILSSNKMTWDYSHSNPWDEPKKY